MKFKKNILSLACIILLSYGLTLFSLSPHGGILYFIWHKYYYMTFIPLFIYYLITISLLWYIFSNVNFGRISPLRKTTVVISVILIGIIFTYTSLLAPVKVNNMNFSYVRGFPLKFYLPIEDYRISECLTGVSVENGKYVSKFPMYYTFPKPQEYAFHIFKIPFLVDILFFSGIIFLLQLLVAYVKRRRLTGSYTTNNGKK
jgi:hypothetical protein